MSFKIPKLEDIYDKIESEENTPMSKTDGYQWGLDYLNDTLKQLENLERQALAKNNPMFYNDIRMSIQRAKDAQKELRNQLTNS